MTHLTAYDIYTGYNQNTKLTSLKVYFCIHVLQY